MRTPTVITFVAALLTVACGDSTPPPPDATPATDAPSPDATAADAPRDQTTTDASGDVPATRCQSDRDCPGSLFCLREESRCVACRDDRDCAAGRRCGPDRTCRAGCLPGERMDCYGGPEATRGVGRCTAGMRTCDDAGNLGPCIGEVTPASGETCGNAMDDDCNGMVDDGCGTMCRDGATRACYDGPTGTEGRGLCRGGMQTCARGAWGACAGQALPQAEVCDGMDNDCDGTTDGMRAEATCPMPPNGTAACMGRCVIRACSEGFGDCNGNAADGCETDVRRSAMHCGACGNTCAVDQSCVLGRCATDYGDLGVQSGSVCVRRRSGRVFCWGGNSLGDLGVGDTESRSGPTPVAGVTDARQLTTGNGGCVLRSSGQVSCWGRGVIGVAPDYSRQQVVATPTDVPGLSRVEQILGANSDLGPGNCARQTGGAVFCWGSAIMRGNTSTSPEIIPGPPVDGLSDATLLLGSSSGFCARRSSGAVVCWGYLGALARNGVRVPVEVPALRDAIQTTAVGQMLCGLFRDGSVACLGYDLSGATITGTLMIPGWTDIVYLAPTQYASHLCAVRRDGRVTCMGDNADGALGVSTSPSNRMSPVDVPGVTNVVQVGCGYNFTCALGSSGAVTCWGRNVNGQLGLPRGMPANSPPVTVAVPMS